MVFKRNGGFQRGVDYATRRKQLKAQRAFTAQQLRLKELRLKELLLENALTARRTGTGPDDDHIARLMLDWQIIREALEGQ